MNIFISYAREERSLAQRLSAALNAAGFDSFLDTKDLLPGQEFNARIKAAVDKADIFIFLASQDSVNPGSYALTELAFAEAKWRNPAGYVLPVVTASFDAGALPAYLRPINALQIRGNLEAEVVAWVEERAAQGGGGGFGQLSLEERLEQWTRLSQPPIRRVRGVPRSSIGMFFGGVIVMLFIAFIVASDNLGQADSFFQVFFLSFGFIGFLMVVGAVFKAIRGLVGGAKPVAAAILDRESRKDITIIYLQTVKGERLRLEPVSKAATGTYPGELGWAYVSGGLLLDFVAGARAPRGEPGAPVQQTGAHRNR